MADEREDDDLSPPDVPDPDASAFPVASASAGAMPELDALGMAVDAIRAADAPPEPPPPLPDRGLYADIESAVSADMQSEPSPPPASISDASVATHALPHRADAISPPSMPEAYTPPTNYADFQREINSLTRADGSPWHPNAKAAARRTWQQAHDGFGTEGPAGQEYLGAEQRDKERNYQEADKDRAVIVTDLFKLLTQTAIEQARELTQLRDALLRNRQ